MKSPTRRAAVAAIVVATMALAACGSSSKTADSSTSTTTTASSTESSSMASATGSDTGTSGSDSAMSSDMTSGSSSTPDASSASGSSTSGGGLPSVADGSGKGKKVVYVPGLTGVPFYSSVSCGAGTEAKRLGVDFTTQGDPTFAVDKQTAIINSLTSSKPDAIMISITDPKAMIAPLQAAKDAGIKIIGIDGDLTDESVMSTNIQSDNIKGGAIAADRMGQVIGGKGSVAVVDNATGSIISGARVKGFKDEMAAKYPDVKVLDPQYSANSVDKAATIVKSTISNDPSVTGIYGVETNNTQGAITGVQEAGKSGQVHIVGYDTSDPIIKAVQAKQVDGTVAQYPYGEGILGIDSAVILFNGGTVPRQQQTPFLMVTPDNVNTPEAKKFIYSTNC